MVPASLIMGSIVWRPARPAAERALSCAAHISSMKTSSTATAPARLPKRVNKGIKEAGQFATMTHAEPAITLNDIDWAREVTGTTAANDARYAEVMAQVFAAASTSISPAPADQVEPRVPAHAVFETPVPASCDGDGGRVSGGPDDFGMYSFTEHDSCEPYGLSLHHLTFTDPDQQPTSEHYAASLAFIAGENRRDAMSGFFRSRANSAADGADAADALAASVDRSQQPDIAEHLNAVEEATELVTAARRSGAEQLSDDMIRLNENAIRAGQALATGLGFIQAPEKDS